MSSPLAEMLPAALVPVIASTGAAAALAEDVACMSIAAADAAAARPAAQPAALPAGEPIGCAPGVRALTVVVLAGDNASPLASRETLDVLSVAHMRGNEVHVVLTGEKEPIGFAEAMKSVRLVAPSVSVHGPDLPRGTLLRLPQQPADAGGAADGAAATDVNIDLKLGVAAGAEATSVARAAALKSPGWRGAMRPLKRVAGGVCDFAWLGWPSSSAAAPAAAPAAAAAGVLTYCGGVAASARLAFERHARGEEVEKVEAEEEALASAQANFNRVVEAMHSHLAGRHVSSLEGVLLGAWQGRRAVRWSVASGDVFWCYIPEGLVRVAFADLEANFYAQFAEQGFAIPSVLCAVDGVGKEVSIPRQTTGATCRLIMSAKAQAAAGAAGTAGTAAAMYCSCTELDSLCGLRVRLVAGVGGNAMLALRPAPR